MPRHSNELRCDRCGLRRRRCICERRCSVRLPWDLCIVQHHKEFYKPSNTARWLETVVENSERWLHAVPGAPLDPRPFTEVEPSYVLFPSADARPLDREELVRWRRSPTPVRLFVLDGTWRNASRMVRRIEGLRELRHVALPAGESSRWPMRRATARDRLCTFEAVLRLSQLGGDHRSAEPLERAFQALLDGQRPDPTGRVRGSHPRS